MSVALLERLSGEWIGTNYLFLAWTPNPEHRSESRLSISSPGGPRFRALAYTWSHEGTAHDGLLLLGPFGEAGDVAGAWVDSWHQSGEIMLLGGTAAPDRVVLRGSFHVSEGPDWGWRIELSVKGDGLLMEMFNVSPEGKEDIGVHVEYAKSA